MSTKADKISIVNSDNKKRYEELYSLQNESNHYLMNTKKSFKNLIQNEEIYIFAAFLVLIIYIVAYWRQWSAGFFIIIALLLAFEGVAIFFVLKSLKQTEILRKRLANKSAELSVDEKEIKIEEKDPATTTVFKHEDVRGIYVAKHNVVILPQAGSAIKPVYLDRSCLSEFKVELEKSGYLELIHELK